jgi:maltose O-acetyltransferase
MSEKSMRERILSGETYRPDDPEVAADMRRARSAAFRINQTDPMDIDSIRAQFTELLGEYGEDADIRPPFQCDLGHQIRFGARSFANFNLVVLDVAPVTVGEDVQIGPNVQLLTAIHPLEAEPRRDKWESAEPIVIGDNVWLGGGVIVLPGVTIGADTVVGAGSVVTKDLPAGVLAVGSPARVVREL